MAEPKVGLRRQPRQRRSRERVERILEAAATLLAEGGPDALRPTHVAERAEVPVGSVYMYFDDRDGLLAVLVERYYAKVRELLDSELADVADLEALLRGLDRAAWRWFRLHVEDPSFTPLMMAILGNPTLRVRNFEDSVEAAELVLARALALAPTTDAAEMRRGILLMMHLFAEALQIALLQADAAERDATFETWMRMVAVQARHLLGLPPVAPPRRRGQPG